MKLVSILEKGRFFEIIFFNDFFPGMFFCQLNFGSFANTVLKPKVLDEEGQMDCAACPCDIFC